MIELGLWQLVSVTPLGMNGLLFTFFEDLFAVLVTVLSGYQKNV